MPISDRNFTAHQRWELAVRRRALAEALIAARKNLGLTQAELAEASGLSRAAIIRLEAGTAGVSTDRLWPLARALHTKPSLLLAAAEEDSDAASTLEPEDL